MGLPPNSAANAHFLLMLRYMLVQDYDTNDDGRADTLRLCFATPRRWLEDGKEIVVERRTDTIRRRFVASQIGSKEQSRDGRD